MDFNDIASITANNGFYVAEARDGTQTNYTVGTLMLLLSLTLCDKYEEDLAGKVADVEKRSQNMTSFTDALTTLNTEMKNNPVDAAKLKEAEDTLETAGFTFTRLTEKNSDALTSAASASQKNGTLQDDIGVLRENVKTALDAVNNDAQLENTNLQSLTTKRNNAFSMAGKTMDEDKQTLQNIIRNM